MQRSNTQWIHWAIDTENRAARQEEERKTSKEVHRVHEVNKGM